MNALSPWVRKLVAVSLLATLIVLAWGWGIAPLRKWSLATVEELQEARFEAARLAQAAEAAQHVSEARIGELENLVASYTVSGLGEAEAMTFAQASIDNLMKENRLVLESIQSIPPVTVGTMRRMGFSVRARGAESRVVDFLAALEKAKPIFKLENLTLRAAVPGGSGNAAAPTIFVEATVFAYWHPPVAEVGK